MTETVRTRIVDTLQDMLQAIAVATPGGDPYGVVFSSVVHGDPSNVYKGKTALAAIYDGQEGVEYRNYPIRYHNLTVDIEVYVLRVANEPALRTLQRYMGAVQRKLGEDRQLSNLAVDTLEVSSDMEEAGIYENYAQGVIRLNVQYRTHIEDPRSQP